MKLINVQVVAPKVGGFGSGQNEQRDAREARMRAFWGHADNQVIHPVGRLLAVMANTTQTIADLLIDEQEIELDTVGVDGKQLPLVAGFTLSLANVSQVWGCIACRSAHGSGTYPSREVSKKLLESNKWYYNPATKALFVVSETCWQDYVKGLGAAGKFVPVPKKVKAVTPSVNEPSRTNPSTPKAIDGPKVPVTTK